MKDALWKTENDCEVVISISHCKTFFLLKYSSLDKYVKSTSGKALSLFIPEVLQLGAITESAFVSGLTRMCPSAGVMQLDNFSTCLQQLRRASPLIEPNRFGIPRQYFSLEYDLWLFFF